MPLAVVSPSTKELVVRGPADCPDDLVFDYLVYGLRIGFEETSVVREKDREARIPSMASHRKRYETEPELRRFNALERYKAMRTEIGKTDPLDLGAAHALRDAISEYDPAVHRIEWPGMPQVEETSRDRRIDDSDRPDDLRDGISTVGVVDSTVSREAEIEALRARLEALESIIARLSGESGGGAR